MGCLANTIIAAIVAKTNVVSTAIGSAAAGAKGNPADGCIIEIPG
jgi:hypothetical protein